MPICLFVLQPEFNRVCATTSNTCVCVCVCVYASVLIAKGRGEEKKKKREERRESRKWVKRERRDER